MASSTGFNPGIGMQLRIFITSVLVFGLVAAIIGLIMMSTGIAGSGSVFFWLAISLVMVAVQWWMGPIIVKWASGAKELKHEEAPELFEMVKHLTSKAGLPMPKLYIVNNNSPNAFAFGRTQGDSGIAVHSGLLTHLDRHELEAVLAHEIGHINNRDVAVMTLASVLPVMLYYAVLIFAPRDRNSGGNSIITILGAFVAQFIGQLCVMWLSRQREYFADEFSARLTNRPVSLMSALAKISYGSAVPHGENSSSMVKALYFTEPAGAKVDTYEVARAIHSGSEAALTEAVEREKKLGAMELLMTHPLTANRLHNLLRIRKEIGA
ncbi:MAG: M48 family metalloprotease [Candidatus Micrarchaeia archaeon]